MFKHYLTSALRHFAQHKITTAINVLYLWLGLIAFALAYGVDAYSRYLDTQHARASRTHFLTQETLYQGRGFNPVRISLKAATDFAARRPVISRMTARVRRDVDLGWSVA